MENNNIRRSISIISTQMQLINCVETIHKLGCLHNDLIVYSATLSTMNTIVALLKTKSYGNIFQKVDIFFVDYTSIIDNFLIINKFKRYFSSIIDNNYNYCISGNYRFDVYKYFIYRILKNNKNCIPFLIDDGLAILNIAKVRLDDFAKKRWQVEYTSFVNKIILGSYSFNNYNLNKIIFNTIYNIIPSNNDEVVKQEYNYLINNALDFEFKDVDWSKYKAVFLGQPLVKHKYCTKEEYNSLIMKALNKFHNIIYIPHPAEDCMQLDDKIMRNVRIEKSRFCFEIIIASVPSTVTICSFFTSVMPNIKQMGYKNPLISYYFDGINKLQENDKNTLMNVYKHLESLNISVIK